MENSWLLADDSSTFESESDEEEKQLELESRLYSVVHHNDLSQPLSASLTEQFSVECSDSGEISVSFKKPVDDLLANVNLDGKDIIEGVSDLDDDVVIVNETALAPNNRKNNGTEFSFTETPVLRKKRFRYSDINIDELNQINGSTNNSLEVVEGNNTEINYFKPVDLKGRNKRRFQGIKLPTITTLPVQDWKSDSNSHFISVKMNSHEPTLDLNIVRVMADLLKQANPNVGNCRLREYATLLHTLNKKSRQRNNGTTNNNPVTDQYCNGNTPDMIQSKKTQSHQNQSGRSSNNQTTKEVESDEFNSVNLNDPIVNGIISYSMEKCKVIEIEDNKNEFLINLAKNNKKGRNKKDIQQSSGSGSISLNVSSFKPIVNLSSDDEGSKSTVPSIPVSYKASRHNLPKKWTKDMVKFYTRPSKRKLNQSIEQIHNRLKEQSGPEDWMVDYQDRIGVGMFKSTNQWTKKCCKCGHRGHDPVKCDYKAKCHLCAGLDHLAHSCRKRPCLTCGDSRHTLGMDQECRNCYMLYMSNEACRICLSHEHHTAICPDTWRSFHATIDGEKKVPQERQENPRKWCCNCAKRGHFSHECPLPMFSKQPSPFVVNYLLGSSQGGFVHITVPPECYDIINNPQADSFLQNLSNQSGALLEFLAEDRESKITVSGTFEQCNLIKQEIEQYVNTKKRTIKQPTFKNKRRKFRKLKDFMF